MIFVVFCRLFVDLMSILVKLMSILVDDIRSTKIDIRSTCNRQKTTKIMNFDVDIMSTQKSVSTLCLDTDFDVDMMSTKKSTSCRQKSSKIDQKSTKIDQNWSTSCRQTTPDRHRNDTRGVDDTCLFHVDFGLLHVDKLSTCC